MIIECKVVIHEGVQLNKDGSVHTMLFADNQVILQEAEDELQRAVFKPHRISQEYNVSIFLWKTKELAFCDCYPARTNVVVDEYGVEQARDFQYWDVVVRDVENKLSKFRSDCETFQITLKIMLGQKPK